MGRKRVPTTLKGMVTDVFFDLDHTLWDFEKNSDLTFRNLLNAYRIPVEATAFLEAYQPINEYYWKHFREGRISQKELRYKRLKRTFETLSCTVGDDLIHTLSDAYLAELPTHGHLCQGAMALLNHLKPSYTLHIITNGFEEVQHRKLLQSGILSYFTHVVHSETIGIKKPDARIFEWALEKASAAPHQAVMIGDNAEVDVLGATQAGMHAIHVNAHGEKPQPGSIVVADLLEIKQYL